MSEHDDPTPGVSRRHLLQGASAAALIGLTGRTSRAEDEQPAKVSPTGEDDKKAPQDKPPKKLAPMPMRPLGRTGVNVSLFGLGCFPIGKVARADDAVDVVLHAIRAGCTYLDTAPSYSRGASETRVGRALKTLGKDAGGIFVSTKTNTRTADDAKRDLDQSLRRIDRTPIDMVQIHAIKDRDDMARALDPQRGPLKTLLRAKEEKLIRFIGVTGHADPLVMCATIAGYPFDSLLFPLNCVDPHHLPFVQTTLPHSVKLGMGRVAMKVFASGRLPKRGKIDPKACLRYTYGLDISTAIVGCQTVEEVALAAAVARENAPLSTKERVALLAQTKALKGKKTEWYKRI